jgi:hypothetical protein
MTAVAASVGGSSAENRFVRGDGPRMTNRSELPTGRREWRMATAIATGAKSRTRTAIPVEAGPRLVVLLAEQLEMGQVMPWQLSQCWSRWFL